MVQYSTGKRSMSPPCAGIAVAGDPDALSQRPKKRKSESDNDGRTGTDQPRKRGRPKIADSESADNKKAAKKKVLVEDHEEVQEDDPPWRTLGHPFIGRRVFLTSQQQNSASRTVAVEQVGTVTGWIASTDVDTQGNPGYVSEYTNKPADLFHVVFDEELGHPYFPLLLLSQDLEERELLPGLLRATANAASAPPPPIAAANAKTMQGNKPVPVSRLVGPSNSEGSTPSVLAANGKEIVRPAQRKVPRNDSRHGFDLGEASDAALEEASDAAVRVSVSGEDPMIIRMVRARNRVATVVRGNQCPKRDERARKMIESLSKTQLRQKAKIAELSDRILKLGYLIIFLLGTCTFSFVTCIFLLVVKTH
jgi:hypothetical protein